MNYRSQKIRMENDDTRRIKEKWKLIAGLKWIWRMFVSSQVGGKLNFYSYLREQKNWTKYIKQWFSNIGQQAVKDYSLWEGKSIKWALKLYQFIAQRLNKGKRNPQKAWWSHWAEGTKIRFWEVELLREYGAEHQRIGNHAEGALEIFRDFL